MLPCGGTLSKSNMMYRNSPYTDHFHTNANHTTPYNLYSQAIEEILFDHACWKLKTSELAGNVTLK